jgi:hypothetical protein
MFVLQVVDDAKNFVGGENCGAFVAVRKRALPEDPVGSVLDAIIDESILSKNIQFQPTISSRSLS